jgi:hypothetical protein
VSGQQRAFFRIDVAIPVTIHRLDQGGQRWDDFDAETVDLSAGGAMLIGPEPVPVTDRIEIELSSDDPKIDLVCTARVVRSQRTGEASWITACSFERVGSATERELVQFCFAEERAIAQRVSNIRVSLEIPVMIEDGGGKIHRGNTVDMCADGSRVATSSTLKRDEPVTLIFSELWFSRQLCLPARTGTYDGRGIDFAFGELSRADRAAINRAVMAEERRRRRPAA